MGVSQPEQEPNMSTCWGKEKCSIQHVANEDGRERYHNGVVTARAWTKLRGPDQGASYRHELPYSAGCKEGFRNNQNLRHLMSSTLDLASGITSPQYDEEVVPFR